jgi:hypothetical protein
MGITALLLLLPGSNIAQQIVDLCGCAGDPTLQPFSAGNPATYPPGTSGCSSACSSGSVILPLPPDGVLRFSSFTVDGNFTIGFSRNAANTPVTILVSGNVLLRSTVGCCLALHVSANNGSSASNGFAGVGGLGGNGGFRGGDGSALGINGFNIGGAGLGPGGGAPGTPTSGPTGGVFFGLPELVPLIGASGGGGGAGFGTSTSCAGGGGGGGGGGLLIVANGTFTIQEYDVLSQGGSAGSSANTTCAHGGAGGAGGSIRLVASRFVQQGSFGGRLWAQGASGTQGGGNGTDGRIRLESLDASAQTTFSSNPPAIRITGPGPVANPVSPTVKITGVGGQATPAVPQGGYGTIDIVLPAPGVTSVDLATTGVPSGTTLLVTVKPRIGGAAIPATVPLNTCDTAGACTATTAFNLAAGAYIIEARATFQVQ